jgi:uncharacterized protein YaiE (UPF0345 family)
MRKNILRNVIAITSLLYLASIPVGAQESKKEEKFYQVKVKASSGKAAVGVVGKNGYHCNTEYPWKLTIIDGSAVKKVYKKIDAKVFGARKVEFEVPYTSKGSVQGKLKLSMCDDKQCKMETVKLSW